ncbi:MAG: pentapeptide repeat-containing protein [Cyanobacteria bacterium P01_H01_bin.105]
MANLNGFWQFLNTDVKDIPWGELTEKGIEAVSASNDLGEKWEEHKSDLKQLAPYFAKVEPVLEALSDPNAQMIVSGLPFVSVGIGLLRIYLGLRKEDPTFENSVVLVAQLAYLQSLDAVLTQVTNAETIEKLEKVSLQKLLKQQLARLEADKLSASELKIVTSRFRESKLAEQFGEALIEQLQQVELEIAEAQKLMEQVSWGTSRYLYQAIAEAGESVEPLAELYRTGGQKEQDRYISIEGYLQDKIASLPTEQVFDERDPLIAFNDIYVRLDVQPLTQSGEKKKGARPIDIHNWANNVLEQSEPRKVMFIEGDAGQGKSVFCRMFAAEVCKTQAFAYIPLLIRLRSLRAIENTLTETLENCPDLEPVEFVGKEGWLKDKNTRFLIILDGFDELLLQGRASGGLQEFLQQVSDFQERSHHQCLVTGRPLALQGVAQRITQNKTLERVKLQPMNDALQEQWLTKWQAIFGDREVNQFRQFLQACPKEIGNSLAREPLLIYLLARLHREEKLNSSMFADAKKESQAKLSIYQQSVNWVLENQRQDENKRILGLDELEDVRFFLQEAALCVVQSGNETAELDMLKKRIKANTAADVLKKSQEMTGVSEDKALNNLLTTFYLQPGEENKRGSVEFAHKSFGEYLFAERLIAAFEEWTELDRRNRFRLSNWAFWDQVYDLLGFGGLSVEVVEYAFELLEESDIDQVRLFRRLHTFYKSWCDGEFLDQAPNENLPQKKFLQMRDQTIAIGLKQVDIFAGLNTLIFLFKLHANTQPENYPNLLEDDPKPDIWFHPCGEPNIEQFDNGKLLKIILYVNSLGIGTFATTVGPHLNGANLNGANLYSANLYSANLNGANLNSADLNGANLNSANLNGANLNSANLNGANLNSANLNGANLNSANLNRAIFNSANLNGANLNGANLNSADLNNADLNGANLNGTNLNGANLYSADFNGANLNSANLNSANLSSANLSNANLYRADLNRVILSRAVLSRVNLDNAVLSRANLNSANLYSANLNGANLYRADLNRANLNSANLSSTNLSSANLNSANLSNAVLLGARLTTAQNLTSQQLKGETPPLICDATLPPGLEGYHGRDRDRLPAVLRERYPEEFESLEAAKKYINEQHPPRA